MMLLCLFMFLLSSGSVVEGSERKSRDTEQSVIDLDHQEQALFYQILTAIQQGDTGWLIRSLQQSPEHLINVVNEEGETPLFFALQFNAQESTEVGGDRVKIVEVLLLHDFLNIRTTSSSGLSPAELIIKNNYSLQLLELFFNKGGFSLAAHNEGKTLFHHAAQRGRKDILFFLLKEYHDSCDSLNKADSNGNTALHAFMKNIRRYDVGAYPQGNERNEPEVVTLMRLFKEKGADFGVVNHEGKTPLHYAVEYSLFHTPVLPWLLSEISSNAWLKHPSVSAAEGAHVLPSAFGLLTTTISHHRSDSLWCNAYNTFLRHHSLENAHFATAQEVSSSHPHSSSFSHQAGSSMRNRPHAQVEEERADQRVVSAADEDRSQERSFFLFLMKVMQVKIF